MSNSSNDVKSSKPSFSYARAAQGSSVSTSAATSPLLNGKQAPVSNETTPNTTNGNFVNHEKLPSETLNTSQAPPTHSSRSSISSATSAQPAWVNSGPGVHMPPRAVPTPSTTSAPVQFGNFTNTANSPVQSSPIVAKAEAAASGGTAPPPEIQGKEAPQFGSLPQANNLTDSRVPTHSRTNSNASDFRPGMSPNPQQMPIMYHMGNQQPFSQHGQFSPAMPSNYRGGRGGMNQYQGRGGARNVQGSRSNASSPINSAQQQHNMAPNMGSPNMYSPYPMQQQMFQGYGGYPQQFGYNPAQSYSQQHIPQNYMNPQAARSPMSYNQQQYQNPNLQAPTASTMSRSGSALSERPPSTANIGASSAGTPAPSSSTPAFTTPRKKGSSAIRIVNPNSKEEVVLPKTPAPSEHRKENNPSPAPKTDRTASTDLPRPTSAAQVSVETPEQKKAKQDAAKQAILDRIAASKAAEQAELDKKAEAERAAKAEADALAAKEKAAEEEAKVAEEKKRSEEAAKIKEAEDASKAEALEAERVAALQAQREKDEEDERNRVAEREAQEKERASAAADLASQQEAASKDAPAESTEEASALDTIAETAAKDQTPDVIETKLPEDAAAPATSDSSKSVGTQKSKPEKLSVDTAEPSKPTAMTTALRTSKRIEDIHVISYPGEFKAPDSAINKNSREGRIKYDEVFLLQFQKVFTDKPTFSWDETIKVTMGDSDQKSGKAMGGRSGSNRANANPFGGLPAFNAKPLRSSEDRFKQAEKLRAAGIDPATALGGGGPSFERGSNFNKGPSQRKDSLNSPRMDSKRGGGGGAGKGGRAPSNRPEKVQIGAPTIAPEDVKPLANSGNRWTPKRAAEVEPLPGAEVSTNMAPEMVQRKVKGLLNKLTLDNFDRITDQILEIAAQSKDENDGRTLRQVIALTFEKATDEAHFSNMYARFCRKMMECTSDEVKDEGITDKHGNQVVGGLLFRKYLLSRCQEDFERGWKTDLPPKPDGEPQSEEAAMMSDEYYIAAAAKRRGLGLVRFIGELFLLSMLNEKIMQECIRKLLANVTDPEEEEVESLSKLVETVGSALDSTARGHEIMDVYMQRMQQLMSCETLSSRIKFMVLDVIDLRKAGWVGSKTDKGPKTIQEIHDEAAKAAALKEAQRGPSHRGGGGMGGGGGGGGRPDFGRGDARNMSRRQESHGPTLTTTADGWSTLKGPAREPPARAGDLSNFGKFGDKRASSRQGNFGPGGNLSQSTKTNSVQVSRNPSLSGTAREDSRSSQAPPTNAFALLEGNSGDPTEESLETPASDSAPASGRPRLNLLPKGATDGTEAVPNTPTQVPTEESEQIETTETAAEPVEIDEADEKIPMPGDA